VSEHNLGGSWVYDLAKIIFIPMEIQDYHILYSVLSQRNGNMKHHYGGE